MEVIALLRVIAAKELSVLLDEGDIRRVIGRELRSRKVAV